MTSRAAKAQKTRVFLLLFLQKKKILRSFLKKRTKKLLIPGCAPVDGARLFPAKADRYEWPSVAVPSGRITLPTVLTGGPCV
jgi:hypothetical protein